MLLRILKREFSRLFHDSIDAPETVCESSPPVSVNSVNSSGDKSGDLLLLTDQKASQGCCGCRGRPPRYLSMVEVFP